MTVLEAINQSLAPSAIYADRLGIGKNKIDRLLSNMEFVPETRCWRWTRAIVKGYGVVKLRCISDSILPVHRVCHELAHGPVPKELHVHHQVEEPVCCMGRACGNPDHTKSVGVREHIVELTPGTMSNIAAHRDCCAEGHPYTPENTRVVRDGTQQCRECDKIRHKEYRDAVKATKEPVSRLKEKCKRDHLLAGDNLYTFKDRWGNEHRRCLACEAMRNENYRTQYAQILAGENVPVRAPSHLQKSVCKNGHAMEGDNVYLRPDGTGRGCNACRLEKVKQYQSLNREEYLLSRKVNRLKKKNADKGSNSIF